MAAPALAVVTPMGMKMSLTSATFSRSWWLAINWVSGCVVSLECTGSSLSRRSFGTSWSVLIHGGVGSLVVSCGEYGRCLRADDPCTLVFVEETNRFSEQSVQVSVGVLTFVRTNIKDEIFMFDRLELPLEGLGSIRNVNTASNKKTGDKTPQLDVLTDVGSWKFEEPDLV
jgi:hypothetical protein